LEDQQADLARNCATGGEAVVIGKALILARKDLRLVLVCGHGLVQACLLGLLLIFVFSLAGSRQGSVDPAWVAAIFWLASCFSLILITNALFALEEENQSRLGLIMAPMEAQAIWLGKSLAAGSLLLAVQLVFGPACMVFLKVETVVSWVDLCLVLVAVDWGLLVVGAFLGALAQGQSGRESLLTVIVFPLLIPLILAGIRLGGAVLGQTGVATSAWYGVAGAFDAVFTGSALILFPFVYSE
jgi:heme exporter protein B